VLCSSCGKEVPAEAKFCPFCGASFELSATYCPKCKAKMLEGATYCLKCGEKVIADKTAKKVTVRRLKTHHIVFSALFSWVYVIPAIVLLFSRNADAVKVLIFIAVAETVLMMLLTLSGVL